MGFNSGFKGLMYEMESHTFVREQANYGFLYL